VAGLYGFQRSRQGQGPTDSLAHHILNISGTYETPKVRNLGTIGNYALSGWQANAIVQFRSGLPVNITSGVDSNADNNWNDRPNVTGNYKNLVPGRRRLLSTSTTLLSQRLFQALTATSAGTS